MRICGLWIRLLIKIMQSYSNYWFKLVEVIQNLPPPPPHLWTSLQSLHPYMKRIENSKHGLLGYNIWYFLLCLEEAKENIVGFLSFKLSYLSMVKNVKKMDNFDKVCKFLLYLHSNTINFIFKIKKKKSGWDSGGCLLFKNI